MNRNHHERKQQLLAQAGLYRHNIQQARQTVVTGLQPGLLAKGMIGKLALAAFSLSRNGQSGSGGGLAALLPLAASGISLLSRSSLRPVVRKLLIAGAVGALLAFAVKKLAARRAGEESVEF